MKLLRAATFIASVFWLACVVAPYAHASDWVDDSGKQPATAPTPAETPADADQQPRKKKRMKMQTGRVEANDADLNALKGQQGTGDDALKGRADADQSALKGGAQDEGDPSLTPMRPQAGKTVLQGSAMQSDTGPAADPDMDDQELQVEWDKWRNKFLWAVQSGVQEALNNPDDVDLRYDPSRGMVVVRFPLGTTAWFHCKVSADRHILSAKIKQSSGFPNFDNAVLNSIKALEGSSYLRFPKRSQRQFVTQTAGIKTSDSQERQYFKFGDVEKYRVPGQ